MKKNLITTLAMLTIINAAYEMDAFASIKIPASKYERMLGIFKDSEEERNCIQAMEEIMNKITIGDLSDINKELIPGSEITPLYFSILLGRSE